MAVTRGTPVAAANGAFGDTATASVNATGSNALLAFTPWNDSIGTATIGSSGVVFNGSETFTRLYIEETNQRSQAAFLLLNPTQTTANVVATWSATNPSANTFYVVVVPLANVDSNGTIYAAAAASGTSVTSGNVTTTTADGLFLTLFAGRDILTGLSATGAGHSLIDTATDGEGIIWQLGERAGSTTNVTPGFSWTTSVENTIGVVPLNELVVGGGYNAVPAVDYYYRMTGAKE